MPVQIITTYAPHNGHTDGDRRQQWEEIKAILNKTCKRHMIIWRTAANGQIGRDGEEEKTQINATCNIIGPYTRAKNRKSKRHIPNKYMPKTQHDTNGNMEEAKNGKKDRWKQYQHQENMAEKRWAADMKDKYRTPRTSQGEKKKTN